MKVVNNYFYSKPVKWIFLYIFIISGISFLLGSFKPPSITDTAEAADSLLFSSKDKKLEAENTLTTKKPLKNQLRNLSADKSDTIKTITDPIKNYLTKYNAVDFSTSNYPYTIDYQQNLKNKNAIFYILINDIFEENGKLFIKAFKSYMGLNIYLKLQCDRSKIKIMKDAQFYTYVVARIDKISNIFFNTKAVSSPQEDKINIDINLVSNDKNLLITGKCIDMFER